MSSNELKGYFVPYTILHPTNEYFYGRLTQSYHSLEDFRMLIHYRCKLF